MCPGLCGRSNSDLRQNKQVARCPLPAVIMDVNDSLMTSFLNGDPVPTSVKCCGHMMVSSAGMPILSSNLQSSGRNRQGSHRHANIYHK